MSPRLPVAAIVVPGLFFLTEKLLDGPSGHECAATLETFPPAFRSWCTRPTPFWELKSEEHPILRRQLKERQVVPSENYEDLAPAMVAKRRIEASSWSSSCPC